MTAYEKFHNGEMTDYVPTDAELEAQDFTREELLEGLEQAVKQYGLSLPGFGL